MSEQGSDDEGSEMRSEGLGGAVRLRPERLGHETEDRTSPREGWMLNPEGTTAGRLLQFRSATEMQEFVADLEGALETLYTSRPKTASGAAALIVFLAGHRMPGDHPRDEGS